MNVLSLPSYLKKVHKNWEKLQDIRRLFSERKWVESMSLATELIESMENDFYGYYFRGLCNLELKFFEEALSDFQQAWKNAERNRFPKLMEECKEDVSLRIAMVFRVQRKYEMALESVDSTIKSFPNYSEGYILKANIFQDLDRTTEALSCVNDGLNIDPTNSELQDFKNQLIYQYSVEQNEKRRSG